MAEINEKIYVCRCEEVTKEEIEQAINEGATTLTGIKRRTHAGMGLCQGRTCRKLIFQMLNGKVKPEEIVPPTSRLPVRTVGISEFIKGEDD